MIASGPISSWQIDGEEMETVRDFIFWAPKSLQMVNAAMNERCLLLGRRALTNLDSILKSRDITLLTKVRLVKAVVFPVVMYGCVKKSIKILVYIDSIRIPAHFKIYGHFMSLSSALP